MSQRCLGCGVRLDAPDHTHHPRCPLRPREDNQCPAVDQLMGPCILAAGHSGHHAAKTGGGWIVVPRPVEPIDTEVARRIDARAAVQNTPESTLPDSERWVLTAERERNMYRYHARLHPNGKTKTGRPCEICMLLDALEDARFTRDANRETINGLTEHLREAKKTVADRDTTIRGMRRALDIAGEKIAHTVLASGCIESEDCENEWHYWRCPKHEDAHEQEGA